MTYLVGVSTLMTSTSRRACMASRVSTRGVWLSLSPSCKSGRPPSPPPCSREGNEELVCSFTYASSFLSLIINLSSTTSSIYILIQSLSISSFSPLSLPPLISYPLPLSFNPISSHSPFFSSPFSLFIPVFLFSPSSLFSSSPSTTNLYNPPLLLSSLLSPHLCQLY